MKIYFNDKKNICGPKVREARLNKKLTQENFAAKLQVEGMNIERNSISRLESGNRLVTDYELKVIAKVLGVDVRWLLSM